MCGLVTTAIYLGASEETGENQIFGYILAAVLAVPTLLLAFGGILSLASTAMMTRIGSSDPLLIQVLPFIAALSTVFPLFIVALSQMVSRSLQLSVDMGRSSFLAAYTWLTEESGMKPLGALVLLISLLLGLLEKAVP